MEKDEGGVRVDDNICSVISGYPTMFNRPLWIKPFTHVASGCENLLELKKALTQEKELTTQE